MVPLVVALVVTSATGFSVAAPPYTFTGEPSLTAPPTSIGSASLLPGHDLLERQEQRREARTASPQSQDASATAREYELVPKPGGDYVYAGPLFEAHVAADGQVTFADRRVVIEQIGIGPLTFKRNPASGDWSFQSWAEAEGGESSFTQPSRYRPFPDPRQSSGPIDRSPAPLLIRVTGRFDLTDEFDRLVSSRSPNRREHARFLADTLDFRARLAAAHHARRLHVAATQLPAMLDGIWRNSDHTMREKKRLVCLLWNEVDRNQGAGSSFASAFTAWVRLRLPASHADAYTQADLQACNRDGGAFAPYSD